MGWLLKPRVKYVSPLEHRVTSTDTEPFYTKSVSKQFDNVAHIVVWLREGRAAIYILKPDGTYERRIFKQVNMVQSVREKHEVAITYDITAYTVLDDDDCPLAIKPLTEMGVLFTVHYHCGEEPLYREVVCSLDFWMSSKKL